MPSKNLGCALPAPPSHTVCRGGAGVSSWQAPYEGSVGARAEQLPSVVTGSSGQTPSAETSTARAERLPYIGSLGQASFAEVPKMPSRKDSIQWVITAGFIR